jgi:PAS domain S-box-containing protein
MPRPLKILIAEDSPADAELVLRELRRTGFDLEWDRVDTEADFLGRLRPELDVILSDYAMPQFSGPRALELLRESGLDIPFIIVSGTIGEEVAVEVMKLGASDYLLKDRLGRLGLAIEQAMEKARLRREHKRVQASLHESEGRFRQLVANIHDVFWLTNLVKTEMLYVSPAYEEVWGRKCAELYATPRSWYEAIHPGDRERILDAAVTKQVAGTYDEEYRIIRPDGSVRWIRDRAFPVANSAGVADRVAGVARDITEARRAEEELKLFRNLVDQSNDTVEVIDPETGRFLDVNDRGCIELGYSRAEFLSLRVWDVDPLVREEDWPHVVEQMRATGFLNRDGLHRQRQNGTSFPIELRAKWVRLDRDYIVAVVRDISERKRAEERVRQQASMLDHAHEAIIVRDILTRQITFWNKGAERLYGWTAAEAEGRDIGILFAEPDMVPVITDELLIHGECRRERKHVTKTGKELTVSSHVTLVRDETGNPKSALVINFDITAQKNLEAQFLRAQRMESIGTLASGVAHDLNNILAPIMMSVPLLREEMTAEQREGIISTIESSAERGAQIVKQVLTFGRGIEGERCPLPVGPLFREMVKIVRGTFPKDITIEKLITPDLWNVIGDVTQLHQVLLNLCVNARDAMPDGGRLRLAARNLEMDAGYASMVPELKQGPHVLIEVSDTGTGIPPEIVGRIFDPFFTTKEIGKGTGLGLSTVIGIVRSHGGHIDVTSNPEHGTTFRLYMPAAPENELASGTLGPDATAPRGNGETVLIVDDEEPVREAVQRILEAYGYAVLLAADGTEALAVFARNSARVAVVITDLMMPFMDGMALIKALRKMRQDLPVIASTGLGEKARLGELDALKPKAVLTKPFGAKTLLHAVHGALSPSGGE